jgi:hypothetical protein
MWSGSGNMGAESIFAHTLARGVAPGVAFHKKSQESTRWTIYTNSENAVTVQHKCGSPEAQMLLPGPFRHVGSGANPLGHAWCDAAVE